MPVLIFTSKNKILKIRFDAAANIFKYLLNEAILKVEFLDSLKLVDIIPAFKKKVLMISQTSD